MTPTIIEELAAWSSALKYDDIPERVRAKARLQLLSVLGAIHASHGHEIGRLVTDAVGSWAGAGPCTMVPSGKKVDVLSAVYANAALSAALDYDDYLLFGHTGHSAVSVPLALAEYAGAPLPLALTAQVIANEIEGRLGASVVMGPHNGQGWSHIHLLGSAAAAAKILGLDAEQTAHAMGISLYQPTYVLWPGFMGPDSKATTAATPAVTGVQAALLAAKGATGPLDVIEHPQGFLERFSYLPSPFFITGLGRAWVTDTLAYKIYPGCAYIDTAVDAVLQIRDQVALDSGQPFDPGQVKDILVQATILTVEMDNLSKTGGSFDPQSPVSLNFSIPGSVAIAVNTGDLTARDLTKANLKDQAGQILKTADKVRLEHDWALTISFLEAQDRVLPLKKLMAEIDLKKLPGVRSRIQGQYHSQMGFSLADLKALVVQAPQVKSRLWSFGKDRVAGLLSRASGAERDPFDLGRCPLDKFTMPFAARVTVTMQNGAVITRTQEVPFGGPGHPLDMTRNFVVNKYVAEAILNVEEEKAREIERSADKLEDTLTVTKLIAACCI